MHPIIFRLGPITLYSLGLMLAIGVLAASFVVWKKARQNALSDEKVIDIFILSTVFLIIFGRLTYVFSNWNFFANDLGRIFLLIKYPGISFLGGIVAAGLVVLLLAIQAEFSPFLILDFFALAVSTGSVFGFLGCYFDGCMGNDLRSPLILSAIFLCFTFFLSFLSGRINSRASLAKLHKKPGFIFLCYLIFGSVSFLIHSYTKRQIEFWVYAIGLILAIVVWVVRYRDFLAMMKFPANVLTQIKTYLEDRREETEKRLSALKKEDPFEDKSRLLDRASDDSEAQSKAGHERVAAMTHQLSMALVQTRKALTKIKVGKYGICENCGKMIDTDRLAAMPMATLCLACEKKKERR